MTEGLIYRLQREGVDSFDPLRKTGVGGREEIWQFFS